MRLFQTAEFKAWLEALQAWEIEHVKDRLDRIREHSHFGDRKYLGDGLFELRWRNGRRVYFTMAEDDEGRLILLLLGGGKDGQERDIARARQIMGRKGA